MSDGLLVPPGFCLSVPHIAPSDIFLAKASALAMPEFKGVVNLILLCVCKEITVNYNIYNNTQVRIPDR